MIDTKAAPEPSDPTARASSPTKRLTSNRMSPQHERSPRSNVRDEMLGSIGDFSDAGMDTDRMNGPVAGRVSERAPFSPGKNLERCQSEIFNGAPKGYPVSPVARFVAALSLVPSY